MINAHLSITNPFSPVFKTLFVWSRRLTAHKAVEIGVNRCNTFISIALTLTVCREADHAGLRISLGLGGYEIEGALYDTRHRTS